MHARSWDTMRPNDLPVSEEKVNLYRKLRAKLIVTHLTTARAKQKATSECMEISSGDVGIELKRESNEAVPPLPPFLFSLERLFEERSLFFKEFFF